MTLIDPCPTCHHDAPHTADRTSAVRWCARCGAACPGEAPEPGPAITLGDPDFGSATQTPAYAYDTWAATARGVR